MRPPAESTPSAVAREAAAAAAEAPSADAEPRLAAPPVDTSDDDATPEMADAAPDSALPLESRDFVEHEPERRAPHPPRKQHASTTEADENIVADPFANAPPTARTARSDAPVAQTARPAEARRSTGQRVVGALLLALGGVLGFNLVSRMTDEPPAAASLPASVQPPTAAAAALPAIDEDTAITTPVQALVEAAPPAVAPAQLSPAPRAGIGAPLASKPATKIIAAVASPASPPAETAFDQGAVELALGSAAERAKACRKSHDPSGMAVVTVTFAPSGRATNANVSGPPFAGTDTGGCIAAAMRSARVPAFSGDFITVKKTFVVD